MADKNWRTSCVSHLVKLVKGEESNAFRIAVHSAHGAGHVGEWLTEYALTHDRLPGRMRTWSNVLVPKDGAVVDKTELDVLMLHERGVFVFEPKNYSG